MIPTAEEFLKTRGRLLHPEEVLIEFAKLHATEALKQASENLRLTQDQYASDYHDEKRRMLNAYNLDEIK